MARSKRNNSIVTNPDPSEEIRLGVVNACLMMSSDSEKRAEEINGLYHRIDREKDLISRAKEDADVAGQAKRLTKVFGVAKATIKIMRILEGIKKPGDRAAVATQVSLLAKDVGYTDKDLVTLAQEAEATAGQSVGDQGSVFDKTSEGKRRGGAKAQPPHVEEVPPVGAPVPTPGIPLEEAQARFEAANEANPPKRRPGRPRKVQPEAGTFREAQAAGVAEDEARIQAAADKAEKQHTTKRGKGVAAVPPAAAAPVELDDGLDEPPPAPPSTQATGSYSVVH